MRSGRADKILSYSGDSVVHSEHDQFRRISPIS